MKLLKSLILSTAVLAMGISVSLPVDVHATSTVDTHSDTTEVAESPDTGGTLLPEAASTTKEATRNVSPVSIAATGTDPLQTVFNTIFAGLGVYTAFRLRK